MDSGSQPNGSQLVKQGNGSQVVRPNAEPMAGGVGRGDKPGRGRPPKYRTAEERMAAEKEASRLRSQRYRQRRKAASTEPGTWRCSEVVTFGN